VLATAATTKLLFCGNLQLACTRSVAAMAEKLRSSRAELYVDSGVNNPAGTTHHVHYCCRTTLISCCMVRGRTLPLAHCARFCS
jgi:hypothetical protein